MLYENGYWIIAKGDSVAVPFEVALCGKCDNGLIATVIDVEECEGAPGLMLATRIEVECEESSRSLDKECIPGKRGEVLDWLREKCRVEEWPLPPERLMKQMS